MHSTSRDRKGAGWAHERPRRSIRRRLLRSLTVAARSMPLTRNWGGESALQFPRRGRLQNDQKQASHVVDNLETLKNNSHTSWATSKRSKSNLPRRGRLRNDQQELSHDADVSKTIKINSPTTWKTRPTALSHQFGRCASLRVPAKLYPVRRCGYALFSLRELLFCCGHSFFLSGNTFFAPGTSFFRAGHSLFLSGNSFSRVRTPFRVQRTPFSRPRNYWGEGGCEGGHDGTDCVVTWFCCASLQNRGSALARCGISRASSNVIGCRSAVMAGNDIFSTIHNLRGKGFKSYVWRVRGHVARRECHAGRNEYVY